MKTLTQKIAQLTLALALTLGCSLGAQAASLDKATFGQSVAQTLNESKTAKPSSMECLDEQDFLIIDPHIDPVLGLDVSMAKYTFTAGALYNVEINFKSNNVDDYAKLLAYLKAKYGKGEEMDNVFSNKEKFVKYCMWNLQDKSIVISYLDALNLNYKRFSIDIASTKNGVDVIKDFNTAL